MTRTAGAPMGCQRPSRFWGLGCPKIYHEAEDTLVALPLLTRLVPGISNTGKRVAAKTLIRAVYRLLDGRKVRV
ncbi:hypothetical protein, partial [Thiolapillus sp.]|uniref:hypothetical protein n=2 Tax=Thiolapillus sp. TaxID=2017437 RepID=UPI003AF73A36